MPLTPQEIFDLLKGFPHRGCGTDEEEEARETLIARLTGEYGVDVSEEGFNAPSSYIPFLWAVSLGLIAMVLVAPVAPFWATMGALSLFMMHFLFFDWRHSPLIWWIGARSPTANVVARKGEDQKKLVILMAHIDSAPASFAYRQSQIGKFKLNLLISTGVMAVGAFVPLLSLMGVNIGIVGSFIICMALLMPALLGSIDFWRFGYVQGAYDNLSGVAVASAAASRLWADMPKGCEIRLVVTTAEEAGMLGAQHYWRMHRDELKERSASVINLDSLGVGKLAYVTKTGGFTENNYDNALVGAARALPKLDKRFEGVSGRSHHVGDFDSVWFNRDKIKAVTLASYDDQGLMPNIHTMQDTSEKVNMDKLTFAVDYTESLARIAAAQ